MLEIVHNNTPYILDEVLKFECYGSFLNGWRQRKVYVYQPPVDFLQENPNTVISVGYAAYTDQYWICMEPFSTYKSRIVNADWSPYK